MYEFYPENGITCENDKCKKHFYDYIFLKSIINFDEGGKDAKAILNGGTINRVTCPYCKCNFTYETPLLLFSQNHKIYAASTFDDDFIYTSNCENALKIAKSDDLNLRITDYAFEAAEKIRLAYFGIDDAKIEIFKLITFPKCKDMDKAFEYMVFDRVENDFLIFSHRDYTDKILKSFEILKSDFEKFDFDFKPPITGKWAKTDNKWAIKQLEDKK